jgi:hypothetical protein
MGFGKLPNAHGATCQILGQAKSASRRGEILLAPAYEEACYVRGCGPAGLWSHCHGDRVRRSTS